MSQKLTGARFYVTYTTLISRSTWFLFLVFIILSHPSVGQPLPYTKMDTIRAVHRLFDYKRTGGQITTAVGVPLALVGAGAGLFISTAIALINLGKTKNEILPTTLAGGSVGLVPAGFGVARLIRYSRRREDRLIDAYESGEPLPAFVDRKLRPRYFEFMPRTPVNPLF